MLLLLLLVRNQRVVLLPLFERDGNPRGRLHATALRLVFFDEAMEEQEQETFIDDVHKKIKRRRKSRKKKKNKCVVRVSRSIEPIGSSPPSNIALT